jgi:phosphatidate cytidylyltransferase
MALSNLQQRLLSGFLGAFLIIFGILYAEWSYLIVNIGISLLALREFYNLCRTAGYKVSYWLGLFLGLALNSTTYIVLEKQVNPLLFSVGFPTVLVIFVDKLFDKDEKDPMMSLGLTFLGIIYVMLPFCLVHGVATYAGRPVLLGIILLVWANDIGAYFAGKHFGKNKLFERISPNKTWEGTTGGALLVLICGLIWNKLFPDLNTGLWLLLGLIIVPVATIGDLVESMIKRSLKLKDSGDFLPGHGGLLDRIDSLLFVFPFATTIILILISMNLLG